VGSVLLYSLVFLLIKLFFLKEKFGYEGTRILSAYYSKGRGDMKTTAENKFRAQLRLNQQQLRDAISCKLEFEEYIEMLQQKGLIP